MSIADEISAGVARAVRDSREQFKERMRATVMITRAAGRPITDPDTGEVTTPDRVVYLGQGYTRYPGIAQESNPEVGGAVFVISRLIVRIPHGAVIQPGDVVHVVTDPDNPQLEGTRVRVESIDDQSQASAQRLLCSDHQGAT